MVKPSKRGWHLPQGLFFKISRDRFLCFHQQLKVLGGGVGNPRRDLEGSPGRPAGAGLRDMWTMVPGMGLRGSSPWHLSF